MRFTKSPWRWMFLSALWISASCGGESPRVSVEFEALTPETVFSSLEDRLTSAETVQMDFHIESEGAVTVELSGSLRAEPDNILELSASGNFAGQDVDLMVESDGRGMVYGNRADPSRGSAPNNLNEAVLIGLTRMGILHNLARLAGNAPPDGAQGGVRDWVVADSITREAGPRGQEDFVSIHFIMHVAGSRVGSASLELNKAGLPITRRQIVHFPDGDMYVVEEYRNLRMDP